MSFSKCKYPTTTIGVWDITKLSNPLLQENGMPKKRLDAALTLTLCLFINLQVTIQDHENISSGMKTLLTGLFFLSCRLVRT